MYFYRGQEGPLLEKIDQTDVKRRLQIFKKIDHLGKFSTVQQALSAKIVSGPIHQELGVDIYGVHVHTANKIQFRLPFTEFLESYIFLDIESRAKLNPREYAELGKRAFQKYLEVKNDPTKYEQLQITN
jgi:hypothetical protein